MAGEIHGFSLSECGQLGGSSKGCIRSSFVPDAISFLGSLLLEACGGLGATSNEHRALVRLCCGCPSLDGIQNPVVRAKGGTGSYNQRASIWVILTHPSLETGRRDSLTLITSLKSDGTVLELPTLGLIAGLGSLVPSPHLTSIHPHCHRSTP